MLFTKKQIIKYATMALVFSCVFILCLPIGDAAKKFKSFPQAMCDQINEGVIGVYKTNLTNTHTEMNLGNGVVVESDSNELYAYITKTEKTAADRGDNIVLYVLNGTKALAGFIILIIGLAHAFQNIEKGQDPVESIYKAFVEIFLTAFFMINIDKVLEWIVLFGDYITNMVLNFSGSATSGGITLMAICGDNTPSGGNWWKAVAILFIPWVCSLLMGVVAQFTCFSILIELGIRKAFAPLAVCDIYGEGMRSPGVRYLKKYLAAFFKIAVALFVCTLGNELVEIMAQGGVPGSDSALGDAIKYVFNTIAINFTVLGIIMKAGEYTNDIAGV